MDEFGLIDRFFAAADCGRGDVRLGIGDDAALLAPRPGELLVAAVDTLVEGVHFPSGTLAEAIGYKALAVNLSDLAAMGAEPAWATLALTLPEADEAWFRGFAEGFLELAREVGLCLVGGDTTRGPLTVTVQVLGWVPEDMALRRSGARPDDLVCVTGTLGDAALGLRFAKGLPPLDEAAGAFCRGRLERPVPRLAAGQALRGLAGAAIDVSDGLLADLSHVLEASGVGAEIDVDALPRSDAFKALVTPEEADWHELPLAGGDDYELCFTLPLERLEAAREALAPVPLAVIGRITAEPGLRCRDAEGRPCRARVRGYRHFGDNPA